MRPLISLLFLYIFRLVHGVRGVCAIASVEHTRAISPFLVINAAWHFTCEPRMYMRFVFVLLGFYLLFCRPSLAPLSGMLRAFTPSAPRAHKQTKQNIIYGYCGGRKSVIANSDRHHLRFYDFLFSFLVQRMFVILVFFFRYQVLLCSSQTHNE